MRLSCHLSLLNLHSCRPYVPRSFTLGCKLGCFTNPYTLVLLTIASTQYLAVMGKLLFKSNFFLQLLVTDVKKVINYFTFYKISKVTCYDYNYLSKVKKLFFCYVHLAAECDCNDNVVATKVADVDAPLGIDATAPLAFTVIVFHTPGRLASKVK